MYLLIGLLVAATLGYAQQKATIKGFVADKATGQSLPGANVLIEGTRLGVCANADGYFRIDSIPTGTQTVLVSLAGYKKKHQQISFEPFEEKSIVFSLEEEAYQYNPVTVTATRQRSTVSDVPASVEVVSIDQMKTLTPQTVSDALQSIAGVFTKDYGGIGDMKTISIRGSTSGQVLVLIDGQRLNSAQSGEVDLSSVPIAGVDRIEVVRGSASALYGTDAVGGVINIITKRKPLEPSLTANLNIMGGSFGTYSADIGSSYSENELFSIVTYKYLKTQGDFEYTDRSQHTLRRENADFTSQSLFARSNWSRGEGNEAQSVSLSTQLFHSDAGNPGSIDQPNPIARKKSTSEAFNLIYDQKLFSAYQNIQIQAYLHNSEFSYDDDFAYVPIHTYNHSIASGTELQSQCVLAPWNTITAGYAFRVDRLFDTGPIGGQNRRTHSVYGQAELSLPLEDGSIIRRIVVIPAVRWDDFSDFGGNISPKISFLVSTGTDWQGSLKMNYGNSFRAPSFNDLYWPRDAWTQGNINLKSESGTDFDIGILVRYPSMYELAIDVTYFRNIIEDMIVWMPNPTIWSPQNIGKAALSGNEIKIGVSPLEQMLRLEWNYTYLYALNETDKPNEKGNLLPYRPKHVHNAQATLTIGEFVGGATWSYSSRSFTNVANTVSVQEHHSIDAMLGYTVQLDTYSIMLKLEAKNIEGKNFEVIEGFPMPGREFRGSAQMKLHQVL